MGLFSISKQQLQIKCSFKSLAFDADTSLLFDSTVVTAAASESKFDSVLEDFIFLVEDDDTFDGFKFDLRNLSMNLNLPIIGSDMFSW